MRIGTYQVLLELARGGMGKVYLARTIGPGGIERLVAIKRAHEHLLVTSKVVAERFLDEARIAAHVHHSNVIGVHQAGADDDGYYLVLDYVEGKTLEALIDRARAAGGGIPLRVALAVVCDALAGLHAAHEATDAHGRALGILHRDVSTQNLLVGRDGVTRLSDFGIAKSALSLVVTDELYVQGKLAYMSPEYLQRKPVDRTLDVYAMGMTLWIALSGDTPWPGADEAQLLQSVLVQGVPPLSRSHGAEVAAVVDRACHRDPRERFQTARAMLVALEEAGEAIGGIARHVEVAEFVERIAGSELSERRSLIKRRREEFEPEEPRADDQRIPTEVLRRTWEEPKPRRALFVVALVAVAVAAGVAALRHGAPHDAAPAGSAGSRAPIATSHVPPAPSAPPDDAPATSTEPSQATSSTPPPASNPRNQTRRHKDPPAPRPVAPFSTSNPYR